MVDVVSGNVSEVVAEHPTTIPVAYEFGVKQLDSATAATVAGFAATFDLEHVSQSDPRSLGHQVMVFASHRRQRCVDCGSRLVLRQGDEGAWVVSEDVRFRGREPLRLFAVEDARAYVRARLPDAGWSLPTGTSVVARDYDRDLMSVSVWADNGACQRQYRVTVRVPGDATRRADVAIQGLTLDHEGCRWRHRLGSWLRGAVTRIGQLAT